MSAVEPQPVGRFGIRQDKRLGELLLENGLLTAEQLDLALAEGTDVGSPDSQDTERRSFA